MHAIHGANLSSGHSPTLAAVLRLPITVLAMHIALRAVAQVSVVPSNQLHQAAFEKWADKRNTVTAYAPYLMPVGASDSVARAGSKKVPTKWLGRKLKTEHLLAVRQPDFTLNLDPAVVFELSPETDAIGRRLFTNARGYQVDGTVGKNLFFITSFYEVQSIFPDYLDSVAYSRGSFNDGGGELRGAVPGFSRWKPFNTSTSYDYDYSLGTGLVGYTYASNSFIMAGHDKQRLGYGHRSLLLSDANAPFAQLRWQHGFWRGRLTFSTTYAVLQSLERIAPNYGNKEASFSKFGGRFSYLHWQPNHRLGLGIFNGSNWRLARNSMPSAFYYSPVGWGGDALTNLVGINTFVRPTKWLRLYGQAALNANSYGGGVQLGAQVSEPVKGLWLRAEFNALQPGLYNSSAAADSLGEWLDAPAAAYYQHNDQSLGHPMGLGLNEWLALGRYRLGDFFTEFTFIHTVKLPNPAGTNNVAFARAEVGYIINRATMLQLVAGVLVRKERWQQQSLNDNYPYLSLRTNIFNRPTEF